MSKLHVTVEHGEQRVEFDSPAGEGNPEITDVFGVAAKKLKKPVKQLPQKPKFPQKLPQKSLKSPQRSQSIMPVTSAFRALANLVDPSTEPAEEDAVYEEDDPDYEEAPVEEANSGISDDDEDDFGGVFDVITKPAKAAAKGVSKAVGGASSATKKVTSVGAKGISRFTKTAANAAGHGAHTLVKATNKVTGEVSDAARSLPVVGKPLHAAIGAALEPAKLAAAVASGRRIDKAVVDSFRRSVHSAQTLAPYAQLVVSAVPGIGTGLSAAIAGGLVLAEGRPINEAAVAAARAAVPGGPMAASAFDAAVAVASGKSVDDAAVEAAITAAAPDAASRSRLKAALEVAGGVAKGKPIDKVALSAAAHALPGEAQAKAEASIGKPDASLKVYDELTSTMPTAVTRAMVSGVALGAAKGAQQDLHAAITSNRGVETLKKAGAEVVAKSDVMKTAAGDVPDREAFDLGIGLMRHSGVTQPAVNYLRDRLTPRGKVSFDAALAIHVGAVSNPRITAETRHKVGFYAVAGSLAGDPNQRAGIVKLLSKNPAAKSGAAVAIKAIRRRRSLWRRIVEWLKGKTTGSK